MRGAESCQRPRGNTRSSHLLKGRDLKHAWSAFHLEVRVSARRLLPRHQNPSAAFSVDPSVLPAERFRETTRRAESCQRPHVRAGTRARRTDPPGLRFQNAALLSTEHARHAGKSCECVRRNVFREARSRRSVPCPQAREKRPVRPPPSMRVHSSTWISACACTSFRAGLPGRAWSANFKERKSKNFSRFARCNGERLVARRAAKGCDMLTFEGS